VGRYTALARKHCSKRPQGDECTEAVGSKRSVKINNIHNDIYNNYKPPSPAPVAGGDTNLRTTKLTNLTEIPTGEGNGLGLVARWSREFGFVSVHDPTTGEWHDLPTKEAPDWAVRESRKRKELHKSGNRRAYRLTSAEMEEVWEGAQAEMWNEPYRPAGARKGLVYDDEREEEEEEDGA
jgi:hypothetical protein